MYQSKLVIRGALAALTAMAVLGGLAACGDSDDGTADRPTDAPPPAAGSSGAGDDANRPEPGVGKTPEERRVAAVVSDMYRAFGARDAKGVCATMSRAARAQIAQTVPGGTTVPPEDRTCAASFAKFLDAAAPSGLLERTLQARVTAVSVDGPNAVATVSFGAATGKMALRKEEGEWRMNGAPIGGRTGDMTAS
jgi:hypothetical protein